MQLSWLFWHISQQVSGQQSPWTPLQMTHRLLIPPVEQEPPEPPTEQDFTSPLAHST